MKKLINKLYPYLPAWLTRLIDAPGRIDRLHRKVSNLQSELSKTRSANIDWHAMRGRSAVVFLGQLNGQDYVEIWTVGDVDFKDMVQWAKERGERGLLDTPYSHRDFARHVWLKDDRMKSDII